MASINPDIKYTRVHPISLHECIERNSSAILSGRKRECDVMCRLANKGGWL